MTVSSDTANGKRGRKDKLIMGCERGRDYKSKNAYEISKSSEGIYIMKLKYPLRLRSAPSGSGWKVIVR